MVNETLMKARNRAPVKTRESELTSVRNSNGTNKPALLKQGESELTSEWNPVGISKPCTTETRESELTGEWKPNDKHCSVHHWTTTKCTHWWIKA